MSHILYSAVSSLVSLLPTTSVMDTITTVTIPPSDSQFPITTIIIALCVVVVVVVAMVLGTIIVVVRSRHSSLHLSKDIR